jgi:hypothetical protein
MTEVTRTAQVVDVVLLHSVNEWIHLGSWF